VVDDNEMNIYALDLLLETMGYKCDYAVEATKAIEMVKEKQRSATCHCQYKIIFMDLNMPIMDGYQACRRITRMAKSKVITPIALIATTASLLKDTIEKGEKAGFSGYLAKPI